MLELFAIFQIMENPNTTGETIDEQTKLMYMKKKLMTVSRQEEK